MCELVIGGVLGYLLAGNIVFAINLTLSGPPEAFELTMFEAWFDTMMSWPLALYHILLGEQER